MCPAICIIGAPAAKLPEIREPRRRRNRGAVDDRYARLEVAVAELRQELAELRARIDLRGDSMDQAPPSTASIPETFDAGTLQRWLALTGRTLVILGGAYLLRALTEAHVVPVSTGVALGLAYGAPWLFLASRAGTRGAQAEAFAYALATALIGFPLVWEATFRFAVLSPPQSAVLLGVLTAGALVLAAAMGLQSLAWIVMCGALASSLSLAIATAAWPPYTLLIVALGVATLWLAYLKRWMALPWPAAAVANLMVFIVTGRAATSGSVRGALAMQAVLLLGYFGSFAAETVVRRRRAGAFDAAQAIGVLAFGVGGAVFLLRADPFMLRLLGGGALGASAAAYALAVMMVRREHRNAAFYSGIGIILALGGVMLVLGNPAGSLAYAALGLIVFHRRARSLLLPLQSAIYLYAAAMSSSLIATAMAAVAVPFSQWPRLDAFAAFALAALAAGAWLHSRRGAAEPAADVAVPRVALIWLAFAAAIAVSILAAAHALAAVGGTDGAALSTVRTSILVIATLAAARARTSARWREAGWLTYPVLVATGLKILFVDFPQGRPATLFVALAMYGLALIVAGRGKPRPAERAWQPTS
jgi:hypothetical protein